MRDLPLAYLNPLFDVFKELRETYQDMTVAQALAFTAIASNPGIPMKQIEKITGLSDSSVSRICHILGNKGNRNTQPLHLVHAVPMPDDARVLTMHLTQRGRHLAQAIAAPVEQAAQAKKPAASSAQSAGWRLVRHFRGQVPSPWRLQSPSGEIMPGEFSSEGEAIAAAAHYLSTGTTTPVTKPQRKRSIEID